MFLIMLSWPYGYPPYGREVNVNCWDKHPTGSLHAEFWRYILHIQIKIPTSAHQAELGRYPQKIYIKKRAITIFKHLNSSSPRQPAFQNPPNPKAEPGKSPPYQLVLRLTAPSRTHSDRSHNKTTFLRPMRAKQN